MKEPDPSTPACKRLYLTPGQIADQYGFTARHWGRMAASGKVPGSYQPSGDRGRWVFDQAEFRKWWASRQRLASEWRVASVGRGRRAGAPAVLPHKTAETLRDEITATLKRILTKSSGR